MNDDRFDSLGKAINLPRGEDIGRHVRWREFVLAEMRREDTPSHVDHHSSLYVLHADQANNAVSNVISALGIADGVARDPSEFPLQTLVWSLLEMSASYRFQVRDPCGKISRFSIGVVRLLVEKLFAAKCRIEVGKRSFQHFPKVERASYARIKDERRAIALFWEGWAIPRMGHWLDRIASDRTLLLRWGCCLRARQIVRQPLNEIFDNV